MYKDNLQAAQARADAAEKRAEEAERKLKENKRIDWLWPYKWLWANIGMIVGTGLVILSLVGIGYCCHAMNESDERDRNYASCVTNSCYVKCRENPNVVTSSWSWVYSNSIFSCRCHLKEGEKLLHLRVSPKCQKILEE